MPSFEHHGATIHYEEHGQGFPILTFAPAGLRSTIAVWGQPMAPINPIAEWSGNYRVIVMDQRNAGGQSRAPITAQDNWDSYTADHIAVLDRLRIDRCHLYGQCIGGSFIINMLKRHPERVAAAVMAQPIGRVGPLKPEWNANFKGWTETLKDRPEATQPVLDTFYRNLYAPGFAYSADRDFVKTIKAPCLVLAGNDEAHPWPISEELSQLIPGCEFVKEWKTEPALTAAKVKVKEFLAKHTPR
ncbi:MAG: alpha/beta hydrolase [Alphaproteobacteria bacterium]|nr:alpha/beta hydrolase [Alphaproteobacteria bacterium]MBV9153750.1 alpha/beta hydrolase [Alphaproteobacteria bacterium]MBV9583687.1 alpha/beta hydrolase [Alphaproteobacteria bacterium]MBV9968153.1 alpha/beta hydrolase [Alphaproteobacteria bacterium]